MMLMLTPLLACLLWSGEDLPTVTVQSDDTPITRSCRIVIPAKTVLQDKNGDGVLHVQASDIVIEFADGAVLRGSDAQARPDAYEGYGIRIDGQKNVTIRGGRISGYRGGVWATNADGLVLEGIDGSDGRRQRLLSDRFVENRHDWLQPHVNDQNEWLVNYGAALYVEDSKDVTVRRCRVYRSQNALCLDRVNESKVYDNDFSFNSGWGIAMWRSSRNVISRNAVDFCVRGYSHEVYNRGQDSADILVFEQCCDNVFAENSVTHGGDGFFGFAGQEALGQLPAPAPDFDYTRRGNNDNLLVKNDFSYAPAHGIEMTFSFGNRFIANRLVGNSICGVWNGWSQDTLIAGNTIEDNGGMGYGLERGGVNIDHGRNNRIVHNQFKDNRCGVYLWWDPPAPPDPDKSPWNKANVPDWAGTLIAGNEFQGDALAFHIQWLGQVTIGTNTLRDVPKELETEGEPKIVRNDQSPPPVAIPKYPVYGDTRPVGARPQLRGRDKMILTEWGPWDHATPLVRREDAGRKHVYGLYKLPGEPQVTVQGDGVKGRLLPPDKDSEAQRYEVFSDADGVYPYKLTVKAGDFAAEFSDAVVATTWNVTVFPWKTDPNADLAGWRAEAQGPDARQLELDRLEFVRAPHSPIGRVGSASGLVIVPAERLGVLAHTRMPMKRGRWKVEVVHDDGVRVTASGRTIIDEWKGGWMPVRAAGTIDLDADQTVELAVEHYQGSWWMALLLSITPAE